MPRRSDVNELWAQLLGGGRSNARQRQLVKEFSGQLPVTPEVIAAATAGKGRAGTESFLRQLAGESANPLTQLPSALVSPSDYGFIKINGEVVQDKPSRAQAEADAVLRLQQEQARSEAGLSVLQDLAKGTSADAQTARQILGVPVTDEFRGLMTPEEDQVIQARIRAEAAQRSQLEKYVSQPFVTEAQRDEVWAQHQSQFPEFANGQRPKTRAEQMQEMKALKLAQYQQALPDMPLDYDEKGQITVLPGFAEATRAKADLLSNQRAMETAARSQRDDDYRRRSDVLKAAYPDGGPEYVQEQINLYREFYGNQQQPGAQPQPPAPPEPDSSLPVNRAQFDMYRQQANAEGIQLVADQDDYDALEPGEFFIDTADGQKYQKPPRE